MMPFIPPKLAPWIEFGKNTVKLKDGAPDEVKPLFEKLKADLEKGQEDMFQMK